jgi:hypothetical protein
MVTSGSSAAWLARLVWDQEAAGSNPAFPTIETFAETSYLTVVIRHGGGSAATIARARSQYPALLG